VIPARALTIGIDARAAAEVPAGRGRVVRELLRALAERAEDPHRYVLYAREPWSGARLDGRFRWRTIAAGDPRWHLLAARAANRECDVFFSTNSYLTVWFLRIPTVPLVHDLIPFEPEMRPSRRSTVIERLTLGRAVHRSAALLTTTQATADALAKHFPASAPRTVVAPLGGLSVAPADGARVDVHDDNGGGSDDGNGGDPGSADLGTLPAPGFVLAVGTLEPRKNMPRLVAAYRALDPELQAEHPLVVVGALGWETGETLSAIRSLGERCLMLGYVSDGALAELYRRCAVFCYPSLGEGFGLPVLEAMAAGAPVVTSNVSSLPEVGGDAAEYVDPHDVASIAAGLRRVLLDEDRQAELRRAGPPRASEFSWASFARRVLDVLQAASRPS
jgi:glycosyltransferase involved in cell wall biosynthesis